MTSLRSIPLMVGTLAASLMVPSLAFAGPVGGGASASTRGARGSGGYELPERVVGGNAVSLLMPFQIGIVGYLPKARFGFAYDRQLHTRHWLFVSASLLGDHGNFQNFRMDSCGYEDQSGARPPGLCGNGSTMGFDLALGYVYRFYLADQPAIVPFLRGSLGFAWWKYPDLVGDLQQDRDSTFAMTLRPSGGVRVFVTGDLGLGLEVELPVGFSVHDRILPGEGNRVDFLLGVATLLGLEYRF